MPVQATPTCSEQTTGFKAPSAILCSNEGVLGEIGRWCQFIILQLWVLLSKTWNS